MFDSLIAVLRGVITGIWDAITSTGSTLWAIIISVVGIGTALLSTVNGWITDLAAFISSAVLPSVGFTVSSEVGTILGLANRLFPLSELCVFLIAWGTLCAVLMAYHFVKSLIPTVAAS